MPQFKSFLDATHYRPADALNFLKDWKDGQYPQGWGNKPVTWVSQEDARAYAAWAGKRLPHEWEWQLAAQGRDGRIYPWGNDWDAAAVPVPGRARILNAPDDVDAHPKGASEFGVMDLVGNVWQWTDEYVDDHTRAAILRGGSHYQPDGAIWYFPQAYPQRPAWQAAADGAELRPLRHGRLPLRQGCPIDAVRVTWKFRPAGCF